MVDSNEEWEEFILELVESGEINVGDDDLKYLLAGQRQIPRGVVLTAARTEDRSIEYRWVHYKRKWTWHHRYAWFESRGYFDTLTEAAIAAEAAREGEAE